MSVDVKRAIMFAAIAVLILVLLSACKTAPIYRDRPVEVMVPVAQPCATQRPVAPVPLRERTPGWENGSLDVRQKAALVGQAGLNWVTYGQKLHAATAACPEIPN